MADGVGQDRVKDGVGVLQQLRHAAEGRRPLDEMPPEHCPAVAAVRPPPQILVSHFFSERGSFPEFEFANNLTINREINHQIKKTGFTTMELEVWRSKFVNQDY